MRAVRRRDRGDEKLIPLALCIGLKSNRHKKAVRLKRTAFFYFYFLSYKIFQITMSVYYGQNSVPDHLIINHRAGVQGD